MRDLTCPLALLWLVATGTSLPAEAAKIYVYNAPKMLGFNGTIVIDGVIEDGDFERFTGSGRRQLVDVRDQHDLLSKA